MDPCYARDSMLGVGTGKLMARLEARDLPAGTRVTCMGYTAKHPASIN